jgi:hypothetical protein
VGGWPRKQCAIHQVPLAHGATGAINADEITHHQVPLAHGATGAISIYTRSIELC